MVGPPQVRFPRLLAPRSNGSLFFMPVSLESAVPSDNLSCREYLPTEVIFIKKN